MLIYRLKYLQKNTGFIDKYNYINYITYDNWPHPRSCLPLLYLKFYYVFVFAMKNKRFYLFFFVFLKIIGDP